MDPAYEKRGSTPPSGGRGNRSGPGVDHVGGFAPLDVQLVSIGRRQGRAQHLMAAGIAFHLSCVRLLLRNVGAARGIGVEPDVDQDAATALRTSFRIRFW
jgi:hypothetical protein